MEGVTAYDHLMKILIIGDTGSSKRKLLGVYLRDKDLTDTTTLGEQKEVGGWGVVDVMEGNSGQERKC